MKRNLLFIIALFVCVLSFGQGEIDAYRYSNNDLSGTARGQAMGGAFGALGGDMTGVAVNPAGIGIYRSSEIVANMSLTSPIIKGTTNQESNNTFHFDNLSYVSYYPLVKGSMLSLNFGFNYSRVKNFEQRYSASKPEMKSSLTDYMVQLTNGVYHTTWDSGNTDSWYANSNIPWLGILAWDGYLIDPRRGTSNVYESILPEGEKVKPSLKVTEKGKVETYDFTIGSNIVDKFYWGATVSITDLSYVMTSTYEEKFLGVPGSGFSLENYLNTKGSGIQLKAGVILRPANALRIGVAYHSPIWYTMTDYYQGCLIPNLTPRGIYDDNGNEVGLTVTPENASISYNFRTPGSWTFSAAVVLSTQAVVSLDYEIKDYADMNLKDDRGNDWKDVNNIINEDYKNASTIRVGLEFRFTPQLSGRLGYALAQSPYRLNDIKSVGDIIVPAGTIPHYTLSGDVNYLTAGLGFRFTPRFYGDIALVLRTQEDDLYYFPSVKNNGVDSDSFQSTFTNKALKGLVTLGYKF